jgi:dihydropteroate synthase
MYTLNCKGKLLTIDKPLVMGIINATPDSFYQGHLHEGIDNIVALARQMLIDGADIIDVGGQSTRPGSERLNAEAEAARVIPVIEAIHQAFPEAILSIDTYHSKVAAAAVAAGARMVNDISGGTMDEEMLHTVAALQTPYICMHIKGTPDTMQQQASYSDVTLEVLDFFIEKVDACKRAGIHDIIIDPGFGFGKTAEHNFRLLKNLGTFNILQKPILAGLSRKSTIYKTLGITAGEALNGTTALNAIALMNGAEILRVHDVKAAKEVVTLFEAYKNA